MPLQQINVSPAESSKNATYSDQQVCESGGVEVTGRSESQMSSDSSGSTGVEICRICHCEGDAEAGLIAPCYCAGSLRYVHQICLQQWIKSSNTRCCELCRFQFIMHTKTKPFTEWEPLEMNGFERRKLVCAVMFHAIALTCVVWSLYVLIDRTAEEIKQGLLEWPFWTKLIVVAIGFTGGVVFMYIQCKAYMQICQRWKAYNRVIYVQNAPEKQPLSISRVSTAQASKQCSSDYHAADTGRTGLDQPHKPYSDSAPLNNGKDETSIDLKGVRNVHIFFKDENQVTVQDGGEEVGVSCGGQEGSMVGSCCTSRGAGRLEADQTPAMWHIKIGKGVSNDSSSSLRCNEGESREGETRGGSEVKDEAHQVVAARSDREVCDPVLKLQINKAEIVIKFGQGEVSSEETCDKNSSKDTSVNIKIDDKESDPIVIDLVKKAAVEQPKVRVDRAPAITEDGSTLSHQPLYSDLLDRCVESTTEPKVRLERATVTEDGSTLSHQPLYSDLLDRCAESTTEPKVRLDRAAVTEDGSTLSHQPLYSDLLDRCAESTTEPNDSYPSGTDSGSQSPLLLPKNLE